MQYAITAIGLCNAEDWICNWVGNKRWVTGLQWSQQDSFDAAEEERWQLDGEIVGSIKEWGPLSFVKIFKAGHMVPMDQPAAALEMITSFTHGRPLQRLTASNLASATHGHGLCKEAHQLRMSSLTVQ